MFFPAAASAISVDQFGDVATKLARLRRKTIIALTSGASPDEDQPALRRAALQLRRQMRGTKLGRRLRRKVELGRAGSF